MFSNAVITAELTTLPSIRTFADETTRDIRNGVNSKAARRIPRELWPNVRRKLDQIDGPLRNLMLPTHRPPTHPGDMLLREFLEPLGVSQAEAATRMSIPFQRLNRIVKGRRAVSADTALLLDALTGWPPWSSPPRFRCQTASPSTSHGEVVTSLAPLRSLLVSRSR